MADYSRALTKVEIRAIVHGAGSKSLALFERHELTVRDAEALKDLIEVHNVSAFSLAKLYGDGFNVKEIEAIVEMYKDYEVVASYNQLSRLFKMLGYDKKSVQHFMDIAECYLMRSAIPQSRLSFLLRAIHERFRDNIDLVLGILSDNSPEDAHDIFRGIEHPGVKRDDD